MIIQNARVSRVEGERVWVECTTRTACESCHAAENCGTSALSKALPKRTQQLLAVSSLKVKPGQVVEIGIPEESLLRSALVVYLWPLLGLIIGGALGQLVLQADELVVIGCSLAGGAAGALLARQWSLRHGQERALQPQVLRVVSAVQKEAEIPLMK